MNHKQIKLQEDIARSINQENPETDNYLIPELLGRKVRSLLSIKSDLQEVHEALTQLSVNLLTHPEVSLINTALWKSAVITYGKCFCGAEDGGASKLEPKESFKENEYYIPIHNSIMEIRHGYVAHRGVNEYEETIAFFKVDHKHPEYTEYALKSVSAANNQIENLVDYLNVVEHLQKYVEAKMENQFQKLHDKFYNEFTAEQRAELLIK